jgi:hypothetical protein
MGLGGRKWLAGGSSIRTISVDRPGSDSTCSKAGEFAIVCLRCSNTSAGNASAPACWKDLIGTIGPCLAILTVSQDGRRITVVSSSSVHDVRVDSLRCFPEGVRYCSSILRSSWLVNSMLETSCDSQVFQSRLERAESERQGDDPTT